MTIENKKILATLDAGGTVVVPSRQRAVALRLAHTRARLAAGAKVWNSCDIVPWSAWLDRCAEQSRSTGPGALRRLGSAEEWLLWREAAVEACEGTDVLRAASLGEALRRAEQLERDWGLRGADVPIAEAQVLRRARTAFGRRCQELGAYSAADWTRTLPEHRVGAGVTCFAGFDGLGTALAGRLRQLGIGFASSHEQPPRAPAQVIAATDRVAEMQSAALWCRQVLERNPNARLLVVVPQLSLMRAAALRAFEHTLLGDSLLGGSAEALCAIEGGQPLAGFPLVGAALALLALVTGPLEFAALAPLLRSPYIGCGPLTQRLTLELTLRDRNVHAAGAAELLDLARGHRELRDSALLTAMAALKQEMPSRTRESTASWARRYARWLEIGGWPGEGALGSEEQQQRDRVRELLGELALIGAGGTLLGPGDAVELLSALAARTAFDPSSGDAAVTLTESTDDPLVLYDGIWVAGLGAEDWAPPAHPDPFVPVALQRAAGIPAASAEGQWHAARRAMDAWKHCARHCVLSWPEHDGDVPLQPSGLLVQPGERLPGADSRAAARVSPDPLIGALHLQRAREPRPPDRALGAAPGRNLPGGTRALQLQSHCPFRAVAELRLDARPVSDPIPGLDRRERGRIMHRALELVWHSLQDSRSLASRAQAPEELGALVHAAGERALREGLAGRLQPLPAALRQNELRRLDTLILGLLQQETERAASAGFSIAQLEGSQDLLLGGHPIRVRMDRVDRLDDGRLIVIDYKSGAAEPFRPLDERPRHPQLLVYALLAATVPPGHSIAAAVAGAAAVHLNAEGIHWRGAAADPALLPGLKHPRGPMPSWPELLAHWQRVIDRLVREFASGESAVDPLPEACRNCHLPALCRIDAARQAAGDADPELDPADGAAAAGAVDG